MNADFVVASSCLPYVDGLAVGAIVLPCVDGLAIGVSVFANIVLAVVSCMEYCLVELGVSVDGSLGKTPNKYRRKTKTTSVHTPSSL